MGFLPWHDTRVTGTVDAVQRELCAEGFLLRYQPQADGGVDGLPGAEGAFITCTFWLADALYGIGRRRQAHQLFEHLLSLRNDLGLLSEEYDPATGRHSATPHRRSVTSGWSTPPGWPQKARHWWLETCHLTDLADVSDARVTALASMALQASNTPGGGREAVELVHAARTAAKEDQPPSPTLLSLLAAREAVGHAKTGDRAAAVSAISHARQWLDNGRREDEPFWLDFWGPADLAWHETRVALVGGKGKSAEVAARSALASVDITSFPRNHLGYTVGLSSVLTQIGQLDEAISVTSDAIHGVQEIRGSGRFIADLRRTVDLLGHRSTRQRQTSLTQPADFSRRHYDPKRLPTGGPAHTHHLRHRHQC